MQNQGDPLEQIINQPEMDAHENMLVATLQKKNWPYAGKDEETTKAHLKQSAKVKEEAKSEIGHKETANSFDA